MIIVRYNNNDDIDKVNEMYYQLRKLDLKGEVLIFFPQDWDILFNCSMTDLYHYKEMIESAINRKEEQLNEKIKSVVKEMSNDSRKSL